MKAFDILKNIINIIQENLKITVYETFSPRIINIPINEKFLTIEIYSGSENKALITITSYTPQSQGVKVCKDLTKKTIEILNSSKLENLNEICMQNVVFNKKQKAYIQKCKLTFKMPQEKTILVCFGSEKIYANPELSLKFSRNLSIYYSPISGAHCKDLGKTLRKVYGCATSTKEQYERLSDMISHGAVHNLTVEGQTFKAMLTYLERKPKGEIIFSFTEVV